MENPIKQTQWNLFTGIQEYVFQPPLRMPNNSSSHTYVHSTTVYLCSDNDDNVKFSVQVDSISS